MGYTGCWQNDAPHEKRIDMTKSKRIFYLFLLIISTAAYFLFQSNRGKFSTLAYSSKSNISDFNDEVHDPIDRKFIEAKIFQNFSFLKSRVQENGKFVYRENLNSKIKAGSDYNLLRHAGTIYAMANFVHRHGDDKGRALISSSLNYLKENALHPMGAQLFGIYEKQKDLSAEKIKLGALGLSLVAMLSVEEILPASTSKQIMIGLANMILKLQQQDGSFISIYAVQNEQALSPWVSLYYPGEAALGLIMLYEKDGNKKWLNSAILAMEYLANIRRDSKKVPVDHWAVIASVKILSAMIQEGMSSQRIRLVEEHMMQVVDRIAEDATSFPSKHALSNGSPLTTTQATTPTATRLEALLAAYPYMIEHNMNVTKVRKVIEMGTRFLCHAQVYEGSFIGAMLKYPYKPIQDVEDDIKKGVKASETEFRIDYNQHALSAMMAYHDLFLR